MRLFAVLVEELESRPDDADRVVALARWLRSAGQDAGALAGEWLVVDARGGRPARPARLTQAVLGAAASALAAAAGTPPWLFDVGREASAETAEAIALLLPWPDAATSAAPPERVGAQRGLASRPLLAGWMAAWIAAAATPGAAERARAIAATIAALDDPLSRRWAVRAVCGLARPFIAEWQWQRAWAAAFDEDAQAVAWRWHRDGVWRGRADAGAPPSGPVPRPRLFAPLPVAPADAHAALHEAWRLGEAWIEPRWSGLRVQVVHEAGRLAVWQRAGALLNGLLPEAWLVSERWPDPCVIEAVLVGWRDGRAAPVADALAARAGAGAARPGRRKPPVAATTATVASLHLVLVDWHRWAGDEGMATSASQRRARLLAQWPVHEAPGDDAAPTPPPAVFTTPLLRARPGVAGADDAAPAPAHRSRALRALAASARESGWSGVVVRRGDGAIDGAWTLHADEHRVRAVLQYVPTDALGAGAASASALAFVACGFALWNRAPRSAAEQRAAMTAAMAGEFLPPPDDAPGQPGLRLLPLTRAPVALPGDALQRLHAWLRANIGTRFGGVHAVAPALVFEIGFTQLRESRRHRLGAVIADARVLRWIEDAAPGSAHLAEDLAASAGGADIDVPAP